jgi:RES domain-containing protein
VDEASLVSFHDTAWCHVPADEPIRLDKLAGTDGSNRWNREGQPTLYLALDLEVTIAEMARHLDPGSDEAPIRRRLLGLSVRLDGLADLRTASGRARLGGPADPADLLQRELARTLADRAREVEGCRGLVTPSMAFLDDPSRGNVVVFMERRPDGVEGLVHGMREAGVVDLRPSRA